MKLNLKIYAPDLLKFIGCAVITGILYWIDNNRAMVLVISSKQLPEALTGILTFTTLILGFLGVLLPAIMGMKKESVLVGSFFKKVPPKRFSRFIRSNILSGLLLTVCTVIMFFVNDLMKEGFAKAAIIFGWVTVFCCIYFVITTFCVLNLLLRLLVEDNKAEVYPNG